MATQSSIIGAVKIKGVPEEACFTDFTDLLNQLGNYLVVDIPNQSFSNIVISVAQPGQADKDKIWARIGSNGNFLGFYVYANNVWNQVFPTPNQIFWLYGDSTDVPAGYKFLEVSDGIFDLADYTVLMNQAIPPGLVGPY